MSVIHVGTERFPVFHPLQWLSVTTFDENYFILHTSVLKTEAFPLKYQYSPPRLCDAKTQVAFYSIK
jgi:hypothetical protein